MKLIIDIHKKDYQSILNSGQVPYGVVCAIMNGTPFDDGIEVMTKKTEIFGNIGCVFSIRKDSYGFFGHDIPCVLLTDEGDAESEDEKCQKV